MNRSTAKSKASFLASLAALAFVRTLLCAAVVVAFGVIDLIGTPPNPWIEFFQTLAMAVASGIFSFFLLWHMFGTSNFVYRVLVIGLVDLSATSAVLTLWRDFFLSPNDLPVVHMDPAYLFELYRLGVLTFALAVGLLLQSVTHLRMSFATFPQTKATRGPASGLLRLLIAVTIFAASFAALRQVDYVAELYYLRDAMRSIGILEIAPLLIVVLPPLWIAYALGQQRYAWQWHIGWTFAMMIALFAFIQFIPVEAYSTPFQKLTLILSVVAYRLTLAIVLRWVRRYGLEFNSTRQYHVVPEQSTQVTLPGQIRPAIAFSLALVPLALLHLGLARYYLPIAFDSGTGDPWSVARGVRLLQHELHQRPILIQNPLPKRPIDLSLAWWSADGDESVQLEYNDGQIQIIGKEPIDPTILGYLLPAEASIEQLVISPFESAHRQSIARLRGLQTLQIDADNIEASDVRWLAEHTKLSSFHLSCDTLNEEMVNSLRLLRSKAKAVRVLLKYPPPADARRTLQEYSIEHIVYPVDAADPRSFDDMAHELARDDEGQITELDLQEMMITAVGARRFEELPRLRRLRIAHPEQNDGLFSALGRLTSLRQLEIPSYGFSDQSMSHIAALTELRHLQLPLPHYSKFSDPHTIGREDLILPMQRGMYVDRLRDALDMALASHSMNSGLYGSTNVWTASGVYELEKLHKLEFLYLPGWLLDTHNIDAIVGLENLQTLRAPFSVLPAESIQKLGAMEQLRKLTIGIAPTDSDAKSALSTLQGLDDLHLLIFSYELSEKVSVAEAFEKEIQNLLPNCKLRFQYLRWDITSP